MLPFLYACKQIWPNAIGLKIAGQNRIFSTYGSQLQNYCLSIIEVKMPSHVGYLSNLTEHNEDSSIRMYTRLKHFTKLGVCRDAEFLVPFWS
jgi:hypothetical protein